MLEFKTIKNHQHTAVRCRPDFQEHYEIIVAGGGTAGVIAAITAAEHVSVLCVERVTFLGGMGSGIVMGYYYGDGFESNCRKMDLDIKRESVRSYCGLKKWNEEIHPDAKKQYYQTRLEQLGGHICYQSMVTGVWMEDCRVVGVRLLSEGKERDISCGYVIDATAEGSVCRLAGFPVKIGREHDGQCQTYSLVSFVENEEEKLEHVYRDNGFVDTSDCRAVSKAITHGYAHMDEVGAYSQPGKHSMLYLGALFGKREGVSCVGEDCLTGEDILLMQPVKQPLFYTSSCYDTHLYDLGFESETVQDFVYCGLSHLILTQPVPMGAVIPKGSKGLLAAGLSMDIHHDALASVRLKRNVMRSGEAVAMTAVISLKEGQEPADCYPAIQQEMMRRGIYKELPELDSMMKKAGEQTAECMASQNGEERGCGIYYGAKHWNTKQLLECLTLPKTALAAAEALALQGNDAGIKLLLRPGEERYVYLVGKANYTGDYTDWLIGQLDPSRYSLFCTAFSTLVRCAARGDRKAERAVTCLVEDPDFSILLRLNGKKNAEIIERKECFRHYARAVLRRKKECV
ncbi:MAG: FAD-dependent oxidoreductase [Clostridia bacterium]|nr:FAD-dependent oxidoreductase [Clostridia bacterium]